MGGAFLCPVVVQFVAAWANSLGESVECAAQVTAHHGARPFGISGLECSDQFVMITR